MGKDTQIIFGFLLQTKDLPQRNGQMNVVIGEGSRGLCDGAFPFETTHYGPDLTLQRQGGDPVSSSIIVNAILYDKIQCIKECRWPWGWL